MRDVMGIRETDPLPTYSPLEVAYDVPNWSAGLDSMGQAVSAACDRVDMVLPTVTSTVTS